MRTNRKTNKPTTFPVSKTQTEAGTTWTVPAGSVFLGTDRLWVVAKLIVPHPLTLANERLMMAKRFRLAAAVEESSLTEKWNVNCADEPNMVSIEVHDRHSLEPNRAAELLVRLMSELK